VNSQAAAAPGAAAAAPIDLASKSVGNNKITSKAGDSSDLVSKTGDNSFSRLKWLLSSESELFVMVCSVSVSRFML
jgi:hypothetical protein